MILIWQERMVSRAASCLAGVTPAQQDASQEIGVSGIFAYSDKISGATGRRSPSVSGFGAENVPTGDPSRRRPQTCQYVFSKGVP